MNELNFRALQSQKVPDKLMEKLLAIPQTAKKKPAAVPFWRSRAVIAAASLVFVSVLSLTVYFLFGIKNNDPVPVVPFAAASETILSDPLVPSDSIDTDLPYDPTATDGTEQEALNSAPTQASDLPTASAPTPTAQAPTVFPTIRPATPVRPTEIPPAPTSAPTGAPTTRPRPTQVPPAAPTEAAPLEPTEGEGTYPAVHPTQSEPKNYCYAYLPSGGLNGGQLYCWIQDGNGAVMGDANLRSGQHLAEIIAVYDNGYVLARYSPNEHGLKPSSGYHRYGFINDKLETLFEDYAYMTGD